MRGAYDGQPYRVVRTPHPRFARPLPEGEAIVQRWRALWRPGRIQSLRLVPWCSGLTCVPVKDEIAGSNPVGTADCGSALRDPSNWMGLRDRPAAGVPGTVLLDCCAYHRVWMGSRVFVTNRA